MPINYLKIVTNVLMHEENFELKDRLDLSHVSNFYES